LHLVGFIIRNLARCTVTWTSNVEALSDVGKVSVTDTSNEPGRIS